MQNEADLLAGLFHYPRLLLTRGAGSYVWDSQNQRYLDFTSGLGVLALGHGRADLAAVLQKQFLTLSHCSNLFANQPALDLAARLQAASFAARIWFANSGAEANEAALKFARLVGQARGGAQKHAFVGFTRGFHGRTLGALAVTHEPAYRAPFAPMLPGARFATFNDLDSVAAVLDDEVCAVIVEPVQGEGGVLPATSHFLRGLRRLCDAAGAMLIFDEVQCGMGRLGRLFAYEHFDVLPDMVTLAKPLAAGLPLGAVLINEATAEVLRPGHHGSTFAGGPAACAVGLALLDIVNTPEFLAEVRERGVLLQTHLQDVAASAPDVFSGQRGCGLMQALVVRDPKRHPLADILRRASAAGLLVTRAGSDAIRLLPPLNCESQEIIASTTILSQVAQEMS